MSSAFGKNSLSLKSSLAVKCKMDASDLFAVESKRD
jgi:hypothetical protein